MTPKEFELKCKLYGELLDKYNELNELITEEDEAILDILSKNHYIECWAASNFKPNKYIKR